MQSPKKKPKQIPFRKAVTSGTNITIIIIPRGQWTKAVYTRAREAEVNGSTRATLCFSALCERVMGARAHNCTSGCCRFRAAARAAKGCNTVRSHIRRHYSCIELLAAIKVNVLFRPRAPRYTACTPLRHALGAALARSQGRTSADLTSVTQAPVFIDERHNRKASVCVWRGSRSRTRRIGPITKHCFQQSATHLASASCAGQRSSELAAILNGGKAPDGLITREAMPRARCSCCSRAAHQSLLRTLHSSYNRRCTIDSRRRQRTQAPRSHKRTG